MFKTLKIHYANTSEITISLKFQPAKNTCFTVCCVLRVGIEPMINGTMSICSVYSCPVTEIDMIDILVSSHRPWLIRASVK